MSTKVRPISGKNKLATHRGLLGFLFLKYFNKLILTTCVYICFDVFKISEAMFLLLSTTILFTLKRNLTNRSAPRVRFALLVFHFLIDYRSLENYVLCSLDTLAVDRDYLIKIKLSIEIMWRDSDISNITKQNKRPSAWLVKKESRPTNTFSYRLYARQTSSEDPGVPWHPLIYIYTSIRLLLPHVFMTVYLRVSPSVRLAFCKPFLVLVFVESLGAAVTVFCCYWYGCYLNLILLPLNF